MAKIIARNASIGIDDSGNTCRALSGYLNNVTLDLTAEAPEVSAFGDVAKQRLQDGLKDGSLSFDAFFSTGASEVDATLAGILGASTRWVFGPTGSAASSIMYSSCAILDSYSMKFGVNNAATVSAKMSNRSGSVTRTTFA